MYVYLCIYICMCMIHKQKRTPQMRNVNRSNWNLSYLVNLFLFVLNGITLLNAINIFNVRKTI